MTETQKTRGGLDVVNNESTRPYKYGEFDILAVAMQPSTGNWKDFMYTLSRWLIPDKDNKANILKFQPVSPQPNEDWTNDLEKAVEWHRRGIKNTIRHYK